MGQILNQRFAGEHWIFQTQEAVKEAVQRCHDQLRQGGVDRNAAPGEGYRFEARTREELIASQNEAANTSQVDNTQRPAAPAGKVLPVNEKQVADPLAQPEKSNGNGDEQRQGDGPVSWLF